jgi:hypothetical protein
MDELEMIRDLGRDLEHEPPATLAHQRQRLLGMAAGTGSSGSNPRPTGSSPASRATESSPRERAGTADAPGVVTATPGA